jgi:hypothetical protein
MALKNYLFAYSQATSKRLLRSALSSIVGDDVARFNASGRTMLLQTLYGTGSVSHEVGIEVDFLHLHLGTDIEMVAIRYVESSPDDAEGCLFTFEEFEASVVDELTKQIGGNPERLERVREIAQRFGLSERLAARLSSNENSQLIAAATHERIERSFQFRLNSEQLDSLLMATVESMAAAHQEALTRFETRTCLKQLNDSRRAIFNAGILISILPRWPVEPPEAVVIRSIEHHLQNPIAGIYSYKEFGDALRYVFLQSDISYDSFGELETLLNLGLTD